MPSPRLSRAAAFAGLLVTAAIAPAQAPRPPAAAPPGTEERPASREAYDDPWEAYGAGAYDRALEGFVDLQVERPDDPVAELNLGSAQYKVGDFEAAARSFAAVAASAPAELRGEALYNLGNCAYRQGRLTDAVDLYKAALEVDSDDQDAKFNLEFVRNEIRRRHEEAKERQEQQERQQQSGEQPPGEPQGDEGQPKEEDRGAAETPPQEPESGPDADRDGLSDELERTAENPTDPANPDSDGDGLRDGDEDRDRDGRVGPGETDPNNPDSDGDGVPDGAEPGAGSAESEAAAAGEADEGLTPEEAARYLQALEEGRPDQRHAAPGARRRPLKDW